LSETTKREFTPRPALAYFAIIFALASPMIQAAIRPVLEGNFPFPVDRFLSIWVFWIAVAVAYVISVKIEGIPIETFGIKKNTRSLRYRLIELIVAIILGLLVSIVVIGFSTVVRDWLDAPLENTFDPERIIPFWVILPAWLTAAFAEEALFRSYPIERLTMLTGNRWLAAGISILAFIVLHLFGWDWIHVMTVVLPSAILLTGLYLWRGSLWFVVVVHGIVNLPILFLPLIAPFL